MKGTATPQGIECPEWDGALLNGTLSGTANMRWGDNWMVDGVVTARNINAAVFAPALLSEGRAEGSGKFSMRGAPGKLAATGRARRHLHRQPRRARQLRPLARGADRRQGRPPAARSSTR